ncbi:MAG: hypothetical protein ACRDIZ_14990 [Actinomycetota bacterium]
MFAERIHSLLNSAGCSEEIIEGLITPVLEVAFSEGLGVALSFEGIVVAVADQENLSTCSDLDCHALQQLLRFSHQAEIVGHDICDSRGSNNLTLRFQVWGRSRSGRCRGGGQRFNQDLGL